MGRPMTGSVRSLPHACGGVSRLMERARDNRVSSPRLWGCFSVGDRRERARLVFPTPVGVFLIGVSPTFILLGLPHACGGVSVQCSATLFRPQSSPRLWGCFRQGWRLPRNWWVFPTPVGVFPTARARCTPARRLPHACGGCFCPGRTDFRAPAVFPTPVGVFPCRAFAYDHDHCLPHARGGVSALGRRPPHSRASSPGGAGSDSPTASTPYRDPGRNSPSP